LASVRAAKQDKRNRQRLVTRWRSSTVTRRLALIEFQKTHGLTSSSSARSSVATWGISTSI
jgi:hypothetical protein